MTTYKTTMAVNLLIISVIFLTLLFSMVNSFDYCNLERNCLNHEKHIGCEKNIFLKPIESVLPQKMTNKLRKFILNIFNQFRNDIATGVYLIKGFPKASNMRSLRWNYEFEYLCDLSIKKIPYDNYDGCMMTENFKSPWEFHSKQTGNLTSEMLFNSAMEIFFNASLSDIRKWSGFYNAENYQIGCSFGKFLNQKIIPEFVLKCFMNSMSGPTVELSYDAGNPCSKCGTWNEKCDEEQFLGLCVPDKAIGPKGDKGDSCEINSAFRKNMLNVGIPGEKGDMGLHGNPGPKGEPGSSILSLKGDKGDDGLRGPIGMKGSTGTKGNNGTPGLPGLKGEPGEYISTGNVYLPKGDRGIPGLKGNNGLPGVNGKQGIRGPQGQSCEKCLLSDNNKIESLTCNFEYPISFWILYAIVVLGVLFSIALSLEVIRNGYKKFYPALVNAQ